jgi:hypothetical protein
MKGLNSGTEGVVTVDLILTVQKPTPNESTNDAQDLRNGDAGELLSAAIREMPPDETSNPSHVYARVLRKAIHRHYILDGLHLGDVLVALRNAGYSIDARTGRLTVRSQAAL